jgi:hypothetical protein
MVDIKGKEIIKNIRRVECTCVHTTEHENSVLQYVVLYLNQKTKKATILELWLEGMREIDE